MNNRVVANGTPLPGTRTTWPSSRAARATTRRSSATRTRGWTRRRVEDDDDPRLDYYDGVLPGSRSASTCPRVRRAGSSTCAPRARRPERVEGVAGGEPDAPGRGLPERVAHDRFVEWLERQDSGWFAHLSYLPPHPPYAGGGGVLAPVRPRRTLTRRSRRWTPSADPIHEAFMAMRRAAAPTDPDEMRRLEAQYLGMVSEVDAQLGRVVAALETAASGTRPSSWSRRTTASSWVTTDSSRNWASFRRAITLHRPVARPASGNAGSDEVTHFSENVDLLPTLADVLSVDRPAQMRDGRSLDAAPRWRGRSLAQRRSLHEWDYPDEILHPPRQCRYPPAGERRLSLANLCVVLVSDDLAIRRSSPMVRSGASIFVRDPAVEDRMS